MIEKCFYKTIRQIRKDLPLEDLIRCLDDSEQIRAKCHQIDGAYDVKYFLTEAADQEANLHGKLSYFLNQSLKNCLYDVPYLVADSSGNVSITEARSTLRIAEDSLRSETERIAAKLAENPSWIPRRASQRENLVAKVDTTEKMLGESLLAGFRK
ncbi:MAG: hypothetical protein R3C18_21440 [Planctomycetaceae bacterium]